MQKAGAVTRDNIIKSIDYYRRIIFCEIFKYVWNKRIILNPYVHIMNTIHKKSK
jgi:hypothetical protein